MPHEETSAAVASILSNLAKQYTPLDEHSFPASAIANGIKTARISLPGENTVEKQALERELTALASRIQFLEAKAANGTNSLPMTPNEPVSSPFPHADTPISPRSAGSIPRQRSASWVNTLFGRSDGESQPRQLTDEQFMFLREKYDQQEEKIKSQKEIIEQITAQVDEQKHATNVALGTIKGSSDSLEGLRREIDKTSQINDTYQKTIRDIGTIITAVANGDLSKKVLIHAVEKDPEIARFKQTINRMIDQLQEFASQVSLLAREVGTEGRLGGQAVVPNVDGIWAELTDNGMSCQSSNAPGLVTNYSKSTSWHRISQIKSAKLLW